MNRRLLILYTGGTIGMKPTSRGLAPAPDLADFIPRMPELQQAFAGAAPTLEVITCEPLRDSADMRPSDWLRLAGDIRERYDGHDGFVVLHGTDTLAYTSSALSFLVGRPGKPLIVTGAQLPLGHPRSDARNNLVAAITVAARLPAHRAETCVVFGSRILRGNRSTKVSSRAMDAFDSPRFPALGSIGIDIRFGETLSAGVEDTQCEPLLPKRGDVPADDAVALLRLFPGCGPMLSHCLNATENLRGVVVETYGAGNGPGHDRTLLEAIRTAVNRDIVVVAVSQPLDGAVDMHAYAAGSALADAGVVSGGDMTAEAAFTKLYSLLATGQTPAQVARGMQLPLAGEMSASG